MCSPQGYTYVLVCVYYIWYASQWRVRLRKIVSASPSPPEMAGALPVRVFSSLQSPKGSKVWGSERAKDSHEWGAGTEDGWTIHMNSCGLTGPVRVTPFALFFFCGLEALPRTWDYQSNFCLSINIIAPRDMRKEEKERQPRPSFFILQRQVKYTSV